MLDFQAKYATQRMDKDHIIQNYDDTYDFSLELYELHALATMQQIVNHAHSNLYRSLICSCNN